MLSADENFSLESPPVKVTRTGYAHPLKFYTAVYSTEERQIKNWRKRGLLAQPEDLPPLDQPENMPTWWLRNFSRAVPDKILHAARAAGDAKKSDASLPPKNEAKPPASSPAAPAAPPPEMRQREAVEDFEAVEGMTVEQVIVRFRKQLAVLNRDFEQALADPKCDESTVTLRGGRIDKVAERLRKLELSHDEMRKSRGELIDREDAAQDLQRIHTAMASSLESEIIAAFAAPRDVARGFVDRWFGNLRQSRFFADTLPHSVPAA